MINQQHWAVNWVDGMKISKTHFQQQESYWTEQLALLGAGTVNDHNFGLRSAVDVSVNSERVEVHACRLLTRGGHLVLVGPENNTDLQRKTSDLMYGREFSESDRWLVVLCIHPGEYTPIGTPDPEETPLRHPFTAPRLSLELVPAGQLKTAQSVRYALPLARIVYSFQGIERDPDYIPPLTSVGVHDDLLQLHHKWREQLEQLEGNVFEIIRKVKDKHRNKQNSPLSTDLLALSLSIIRYHAQHYDTYRMRLPLRPPVELFGWFVSLARVVHTELRLAGNQENMLTYMAHFVDDFDSTDLLRICSDLTDLAYDHLDIRRIVGPIDRFLTTIGRVFARLKDLDYHDIASPNIVNNRTFSRGDAAPPPRPVARPAAGRSIRITSRNQDRSEEGAPDGNGGGWGLS